MSGIYSKIGAMFGAGHYGTTSESVLALIIAFADRRVIRTGARGPDGDTPHYRHHRLNLTGLFCGDSGTLGVKAEVALRLTRAPQNEDHAYLSASLVRHIKSSPAGRGQG